MSFFNSCKVDAHNVIGPYLLLLIHRAFLTEGMKYNLKLILFWGPGSPFQNNWKLREEFRNPANRSANYIVRTILIQISSHHSMFSLYH